MTDEDRNKSYEFKDKLGQVILTRQINNNQNHDTYYVYDDFGNLCYVLPPLASDALVQNNQSWDESNEILKKYAYLYKYDERNRCIWKRLPGCEPIYYVYDKADQLILSQDGEQHKEDLWAFNAYDAFGRIVFSGIHKNHYPARDHQYFIQRFKDAIVQEKQGWICGYSDILFNLMSEHAYPYHMCNGIMREIKQLYYYDDYRMENWGRIPEGARGALETPPQGFTHTEHSSAKGLLTATIIFTNEPNENAGPCDLPYKMIATAMRYDERGRLIQTRSSNHLDGVDKEFIEYNFTGQPTKKLLVHNIEGKPEITEQYSYTYDHAGRLTETTHSLNGATPVSLAYNEYDELGRLKSTKANNNDRLKLTYDYNIRSWVKEISGSLFSQKLFYNEVTGYMGDYNRNLQGKANYNGNISGAMYKSGTNYWMGYNYFYDNLSRLKKAESFYVGKENRYHDHFDTDYAYDKHGNLTNIFRMECIDGLDALGISHNGNQMFKINNGSTVEFPQTVYNFQDYSGGADVNFEYNANGAMTKDPYKGMTVSYDYNNMPETITVPAISGSIKYIYTATGEKLSADYAWNPRLSLNPVENIGKPNLKPAAFTRTDYVKNKVYKNVGLEGLEMILTENGYIKDGIYYFYLRDHLGNNNVVATAGGQVVQNHFYYPFGMLLGESGTSGHWDMEESGIQPYKYGGKEFDSMHGLNLYDFHARRYNSVLGGFDTMDPLSEKYYSWSPYAYCANNPMKFIDPTGKQVVLPLPLPTSTVKGSLSDINGKNIIPKGSLLYERLYGNPFDEFVSEATASTKEGLAEQRKRQERSLAEDALHMETTNKISTGGHNPKNSDGDFKPDYSKKFGNVVRAIAGAAAGGLFVHQIGGGEDARKDMNEDSQNSSNTINQESSDNNSFDLNQFIIDAAQAGATINYY